MGKVVKFTGSRLLGEELRRLRGGRSLDDVVGLGKSKLVEFGFKGISKTTLSEIENGRTLPNIETVFGLSILYQVPTSRFLHVLLEENLAEGVQWPEDQKALTAAYLEALSARRLSEALSIAIHAQRVAATPLEIVKWRANRAIASEFLGMRWDAINELQACLEGTLLPTQVRFRLHRELGRMHATAAQYLLAEMHLRECATLLPDDASDVDRVGLLQAQIGVKLGRMHAGLAFGPAFREELEALISEGVFRAPSVSASAVIYFVLCRAELARLGGDHATARRLFNSALQDSQGACLHERVAEAHRGLASLDTESDPCRARAHLQAAAALAVDNNFVDLAFETNFLLHELAESAEQAAYYLRKCRKLYPLIQSAHPILRRYEAAIARGGQ